MTTLRVEIPAPPEGLSEARSAFWASLHEQFNFADWHREVLRAALQSFDRADEAKARLDEEGLTVRTATGSKSHPCVAIERDMRALGARLLDSLGLDAEPASPPSRRHRSPDRMARR